LAGLVGLVAASIVILRMRQQPTIAAESDAPQYTADGKLLPPQNYREWIYLSSGLGMEYNTARNPGGEFTNVFVKPSAYHEFMRTGRWPDKTVFVLEERASATKGSINRGGHYQAELKSLAASVKDKRRFPEKWAYFSFRNSTQPVRANARPACFECHNAHGAVDNTFVQFYPTLKPLAEKRGTYSAAKAQADSIRISTPH
jgi:hypothetical protein